MTDPNQSGRVLRERVLELEAEIKRKRTAPAAEVLLLVRQLREARLQLRDYQRAQWGD